MARDTATFPILTPEELCEAEKCGSREHFEAGEMIFKAGDKEVDFFVVASGSIDVLGILNNEERLLTVHRTGSFLGNIAVFGRRPPDVSCRAAEATEVIRLTVAQIRRLVV